MVERRRLRKPEPERFSTGTINWLVLDWTHQNYQAFNLLAVGRPPEGPAYVVRFFGEEGRRVLNLFRSINDDQSKYLRSLRDGPGRLHELCQWAEEYAIDGGEARCHAGQVATVLTEPVTRTGGPPAKTKSGMLF